MGQSNMAGRGEIEGIDTIIHPRVYMLTTDTVWISAKNPMHYDKFKFVGTGLGLSFGIRMAEQDSNVTIGLIPCAKGGSSIDNWITGSFHEGTNSYPYDEAIIRIKNGMNKGVIKGILWHQGEADCKVKGDVQVYEEKFLVFIDSLEKDLGLINIPIIIGEIGYFFYKKRPLAEDLNNVFEKISANNDCIGLVKSDSLNHKGDKVHFNSDSYRVLGLRYANEMIRVQQECQSPTRNKKHRAESAIFERYNTN